MSSAGRQRSNNSESLVDKAVQKVLDSSQLTTIIRKRITEYILGLVGAVVIQTANIIDSGWEVLADSLAAAGAPLTDVIDLVQPPLVSAALTYQGFLITFAGAFGPAAPFVLLILWAATFTVVVVAVVSFGPAITDALGAVPVVGSAADAILTWLQESVYRLINVLRGEE